MWFDDLFHDVHEHCSGFLSQWVRYWSERLTGCDEKSTNVCMDIFGVSMTTLDHQQQQQPTTNNQQPTTHNPQPTTNNQQPTTTIPTSNILRPLPPTLGTAATTTNAHTQNIHSAKLTSLAGKWTRIEDVYSTKIGGYSIQLSSAMFVYQRVIRNIKAIYTNRSRPHPQFLWMTCWTMEINKKTYIVRGGYWKGWHRFMWNPMNIHTYIYMCIYKYILDVSIENSKTPFCAATFQ